METFPVPVAGMQPNGIIRSQSSETLGPTEPGRAVRRGLTSPWAPGPTESDLCRRGAPGRAPRGQSPGQRSLAGLPGALG